MSLIPRYPPSARGDFPHYRPDIDGLRAVAVTAVLAFHAFPDNIPGGFVGVDIFFVISGYLISGILLSEIKEHRFSVLAFYARRARRIFPALVLVLVAVFAAGWLLLLPWEFKLLGKHLLAGAAFASNFTLWSEIGYFDPSADSKPLLHLWSLAIEEQFYLLWPFLLALAAQWGTRAVTTCTLALTLASLMVCVTLSDTPSTSAFYLPVSRFWELLTGALLAMLSHRQPRWMCWPTRGPLCRSWPTVASLTGLVLMLVAIATLNPQATFPGWRALLPVAGAALLIAAGRDAPVNRLLLSRTSVVWVGLISYPLYLWHWPILSFLSIVAPHANSAMARFLGLCAAGILAAATYHGLEKPIRLANHWTLKHVAATMWLALIGLGMTGNLIWRGDILARSDQSNAVRMADAARNDWKEFRTDFWFGQQPGQVLFVGDSHMQQYRPRIEKLFQDRSAALMSAKFNTIGGCAPIRGVTRRQVDCGGFVASTMLAAHDPEVKVVVFAASWYGFLRRDDLYPVGASGGRPIDPASPESLWIFENFERDLSDLVSAGKRVVVLLSIPRGKFFDPTLRIQRSIGQVGDPHPASLSRNEVEALVGPVDKLIRTAALGAGAEVIDPKADLCDAQKCAAREETGEFIYKDASHLRASYVTNHVRFLDDLLTPTGLAAPVN